MVLKTSSQRVLIADDERVIADTLALIFNRKGFEARAVYSGEQAVEAAMTLNPDVLISDVVMGEMSGIEAAALIQGSAPSCRVILISGQASTADLLSHAKSKGQVFEILSKPVHPQILLELLDSSC
jgi:DNA-binding NtrC family response regulator